MSAVSLASAKAHLRVVHDDDDVYLQTLIEAAEGHLASTGVDMEADPLPAPVHHAVLLLVSHLNENRDAVVAGNMPAAILPFGVNALVQPFREETI